LVVSPKGEKKIEKEFETKKNPNLGQGHY